MNSIMKATLKKLLTLDADADQRAEQAARSFADDEYDRVVALTFMAIERRLAAAMLFLIAILAEDDDATD